MYRKKLLSAIDEDEIVAFLQELIRARSDYPPGDTREVAEACSATLRVPSVNTFWIIVASSSM